MHPDVETIERVGITTIEPVAIPIERVPEVVGLTRTRIFAAVANKELTARKAGRATIIELPELRRWLRSLPTRGRQPDSSSS
jgi:hypothetical protein